MGTLTNTGYIPNTTEQSIAQVEELFQFVFGMTVNLATGGIIGQLIQEIAEILIQVENDKSYIYSDLYNPNVANGKFLDGILKFDGIVRHDATYSQITATLTGVSGTVIPSGSKALTTNNDVFILSDTVTLNSSGTGTGLFLSQNPGVVSVSANTLTRIVQNIPGWSTINNPMAGAIGTEIESDNSLRYFQKYRLGINSSGGVQSLISAFTNTLWISYSNVYNNNTSSNYTDPISGLVVPAYSIMASVVINDGNNHDQDIGQIFYNKLPPGTPTSGDHQIIYTPAQYAYSPETFYIQTPQPISVTLVFTIPQNNNYPANLDTYIKNQVVAIFAGQSDQPPILMGDEIFSRRFEKILIDLQIYNIISIVIGTTTTTPGNSLQLGLNQYPVIDPNNITIVRV